MREPFHAAAVQAAPEFLDKEATTSKALRLIEEAAAQDVRLLAFPETWNPGYPWWIWLGSPAEGMAFVPQYHANSLVAGEAEDQAIEAAARRHDMFIVYGVSEKVGGSLYMAQWFYGPNGIIGRRRKLKPTHVERSVFGEGDGSDLQVHDTPLGRLGALCCWEHLQPLTKYAMFSMNEQLHVASWPSFSVYRGAAHALGPEVNNAASQIYAVEGQCFVLAPCATVSEAMFDRLCDSVRKEQLLLRGGGFARIYGPDGARLGDILPETSEGLIVAQLHPEMLAIAKSAADPVGHYSRPDVTRLLLNRKKTLRVMDFDGAAEFVGSAEPVAPPDGAVTNEVKEADGIDRSLHV